jgi:hypothetical protein
MFNQEYSVANSMSILGKKFAKNRTKKFPKKPAKTWVQIYERVLKILILSYFEHSQFG